MPEFLEQIVASGARLWAYRMSADMNDLTEDDLDDEVERIISPSDCVDQAEGTQPLFM